MRKNRFTINGIFSNVIVLMESIEANKMKTKNPWLEYVKELRNEHKELSYKEVLKLAAESYKKVEKVKMKKSKMNPENKDQSND